MMILYPTLRRILNLTGFMGLMLDKVSVKFFVVFSLLLNGWMKRRLCLFIQALIVCILPLPFVIAAEIFSDVQPLVQSALDGYNVSIFAYGQTRSGKTHTMVSLSLSLSWLLTRSLLCICAYLSIKKKKKIFVYMHICVLRYILDLCAFVPKLMFSCIMCMYLFIVY